MPTLYEKPATSALNEDAYINKLYDTAKESTTNAIKNGYEASGKQIASGQQATQNQTNDYIQRAYVEGSNAADNYSKSQKDPYLPEGNIANNAQANLAFNNTNQANKSTLNKQQSAADVEYERQRQLLADQYSSQIKQAQADNDMERAKALYEAAKAEEAQLRELRQKGSDMMLSKKKDRSVLESIAAGTPVQRDTTTETWDGVTRNEDSINKIYDAMMESEREQAQQTLNKNLYALDAKQQAAIDAMDTKLNDTYVNSLRNAMNYQNTQTAYGQNSGAAEQARIARETGLAQDLTNIRALQLGQSAENERARADLAAAYNNEIAKAQQSGDFKRAAELLAAAEREEQNLVADQEYVGNYLANKDKNYEMLARLYGLTPAQIDTLMGRKSSTSSGGGGGGDDWSDYGWYGYAPGSGYNPNASGNGGDGNGSGSTSGSTTNKNSGGGSVISLGYGPISTNTLSGLISSGDVGVTSNGYTRLK